MGEHRIRIAGVGSSNLLFSTTYQSKMFEKVRKSPDLRTFLFSAVCGRSPKHADSQKLWGQNWGQIQFRKEYDPKTAGKAQPLRDAPHAVLHRPWRGPSSRCGRSRSMQASLGDEKRGMPQRHSPQIFFSKRFAASDGYLGAGPLGPLGPPFMSRGIMAKR